MHNQLCRRCAEVAGSIKWGWKQVSAHTEAGEHWRCEPCRTCMKQWLKREQFMADLP